MGYYDGLGGVKTEGSTYDVACTLNLPAVLIVNGRGASLSVLAMIKGFLEYRRDSHICGVILNQVSPMISRRLKNLIEQELGDSCVWLCAEDGGTVSGQPPSGAGLCRERSRH